MRETWVRSLGREVPLEMWMALHSSILAWRIPWTEEPGGLQSIGLQGVRQDWGDLARGMHRKKITLTNKREAQRSKAGRGWRLFLNLLSGRRIRFLAQNSWKGLWGQGSDRRWGRELQQISIWKRKLPLQPRGLFIYLLLGCVCMCVLSHFNHVWLCATLWTVAHQTPLSMRFSRQEYQSGLPCPPLWDLSDPRIEPAFLRSPALAGGFFTTSATWETHLVLKFS